MTSAPKIYPPLKNNPLTEVVFEIQWKLQPGTSGPGFEIDPGFTIFQAKYINFALEGDYPHLVELPASKLPEEMTPHVVRLQLRKAPDKWPVTQIGPGILSVNDTKESYKWETFMPLLIKSFEQLIKNYPADKNALVPTKLVLKFIDSIEFDPTKGSPLLSFIKEKLHTNIKIDDPIFNEEKEDTVTALKLSMNYKLKNPVGIGGITIGNASINDKPHIRLETAIVSLNGSIPKTQAEFSEWLISAHETSGNWFRALCKGELYDSFQ